MLKIILWIKPKQYWRIFNSKFYFLSFLVLRIGTDRSFTDKVLGYFKKNFKYLKTININLWIYATMPIKNVVNKIKGKLVFDIFKKKLFYLNKFYVKFLF